MIVPMKKIHVVVQKKDIVSALESLRELGSVHVEHQESLTGFQLEQRREEVKALEDAIGILETIKVKNPVRQKKVADWTEVVNAILGLSAEVEHCKESIAKRKIQISQWKPWGHFDPKDIDVLAAAGITAKLYLVPKDKKEDIPESIVLETIYSSGGIDRCIAFSKGEIHLAFEEISYPPMSLKEMAVYQKEEEEKVQQALSKIENHYCHLESLETILLERQDVLSFEEVEKGMREDESLAVLKGFCPVDICKNVEQKAAEKQWGILFENPSEGDRVPTLLKNPKWVEMIKPIFGMINIIPGYKEFDVSFLFLAFFAIFVGMLIGDAGYAIVYALFFKFGLPKMIPKKPEQKMFYSLMYLLCGCTFIWGVLTGTYFGQAWVPEVVSPLVPWLRDTYNIQILCFFIGAVHLSIAHVWKAIVQFPSMSFVGELGWLALCWGMFFLAKMLVLSDPFPAYAKIFFVAGTACIILFTRPNINPLKAIGPGLGNFALNVINSFTDVVSYIRLFAVGLATVAVADAANSMSIGWVFFLHTLNILLAAMAILVHGLRLNVLEFSGHLSMEWEGFKYNPFKKIKI